MKKPIISCVVDGSNKFRMQALNWIATLYACGAMKQFRPYMHLVGEHPVNFRRLLRDLGVELVEIEPFGAGPAKYCNKLKQLATFSAENCGVVLTDTDIAFVEPPRSSLPDGIVKAKIVDIENPREPILRELLRRAGFVSQSLNAKPDFSPTGKTHKLNCNGGLYIFGTGAITAICEDWARWSRFCLDNSDLLGDATLHSDQLGFMLAMIPHERRFEPLSVQNNFPTHLLKHQYDGARVDGIQALHYHDGIDRDGLLLPLGIDPVDEVVNVANRMIVATRKELGINAAMFV